MFMSVLGHEAASKKQVHSLFSTQTFQRALTASVNSCVETECSFSGVTKSDRDWRKVPESDVRRVQATP